MKTALPPAFCRFLAAAVALLALAASPLRAEEGALPNLAANGAFTTAGEDPAWPAAWQKEKDGLMTWETENGKRFLRLVSQQPGQYVQVTQAVPLSPEIKGIDFAARFRTANVKFGASFTCDARVRFEFVDAAGAAVKPSPGDAVFDSHAKDWTVMTRQFLVPEGAAQLRVALCLNHPASGTLDVSEVRLTKMSQADVDAIVMAPILAAKKKADDEAEVQRMVVLPPKTEAIKVAGNRLVTAKGTAVQLHGVNVCSLEWSAKGENIPQSVKVALVDWKANAVRLPVFPGFWFGRGKPPQSTANDAEAYRKIVDDVVAMAAGQGAYVILDLHRFHAPEDRDVEFWKDAAARYKNHPAVLFDIFNEAGGISWDVWRNGGEVKDKPKGGAEPRVLFISPGMQGLVNAVRETGARNIIIAGGLGSAYSLEGILQGYALDDKGGNGIMYATHFYNWHRNWEKHFLGLADKYPIFVGEFGADIKKMPFVPAKNQEDPYTWVPDALGMIQKYNLNWTAFCLHPKSTPVLIKNWNYEPTPFWGDFVKRALAGERFPMKNLR
ncbi:MAG: cellulase family glycosylhydrolase [Chthoniobacteraceae bacterium]|nr:cellulase family glycosylhydrolase [Chthoniobacteraceae bacterium]